MVLEQSILSRFVEFLEDRPSDQRILEFKATEGEERRYKALMTRLVNNDLDPDEQYELDDYKRCSHLISMAKIRAYGRIKRDSNE